MILIISLGLLAFTIVALILWATLGIGTKHEDDDAV